MSHYSAYFGYAVQATADSTVSSCSLAVSQVSCWFTLKFSMHNQLVVETKRCILLICTSNEDWRGTKNYCNCPCLKKESSTLIRAIALVLYSRWTDTGSTFACFTPSTLRVDPKWPIDRWSRTRQNQTRRTVKVALSSASIRTNPTQNRTRCCFRAICLTGCPIGWIGCSRAPPNGIISTIGPSFRLSRRDSVRSRLCFIWSRGMSWLCVTLPK